MTLEELSHDSFYNMQKYSQITIDYIQELEDALSEEHLGGREKEDVLEAMAYNIFNVLEVINPSLEADVNALFSLSKIINKELDNAEYL
jgi:hypothetical protein